MTARRYRWASGAAVVVGVSLLFLNVLGLYVDPAAQDPVRTPSMIAGYDYAVLPPAVLRQAMSRESTRIPLAEANSLVFLSLRHSDSRKISPFENWLLWVGGHVYEPLSRTQNTDRLVAGRIGQCGEKAQVLKTVAERAGLPSRFVGLNGHVVLEVKTGSGWQVADPDYGITYPVGLAQLQGEEGVGMMREELKRVGYGEDVVDEYVSLFQSSDDNVVFEAGQPLSPRLHVIERTCDVLKWVVPLSFVAIGLFALRRDGGAGAV